MNAKSHLPDGFSAAVPGIVAGALTTAALLLVPAPASARPPDSHALSPDSIGRTAALPRSHADLAPLLEQHTRGGGSGGGGGTAVPRGGGGGGGGGGSTGGGTHSGGSAPAPSGGGSQTRDGSGTTSSSPGTTGESRARNRQPAEGTAVPRRPGDIPPVGGGGGGYWGGYYPWYPWGWGGIGLGAYYGWGYPGWYDPYPPVDYGYGYDDGGVKLKVKPKKAEVYVDGYFAGIVDDFDGSFQKLRLQPGPHRIEVRLDGYEPLMFEVRILPDRTITYKAEMQKLPNSD